MEDNSAFAYKEKPASNVICSILFSHVGLFFIVSLYAILGALAFIAIEEKHEKTEYNNKINTANSINQTMNYISQVLWFYQANKNMTYAQYNVNVSKQLLDLENQVMAAVNNDYYDGTVYGWTPIWTFAKSLLLTFTIITTIGYGHIAPATFYGQMFCIIYAIVGTPLLLLFLANIGDVMANALTYVYSRCCCRPCRSRRYVSELPPGASKQQLKLLIDDDVGKEEYMPTSKVAVPIIITLVVLSLFVVLGAMYFVYLEDWDFTSSCYFTFITISTIGYGDYYPKTAMVNDLRENFVKTFKMFTVIMYLLFGMALLSMALNLMQDQIMEKCRWLAREIGLSKPDPEEAPPNAKPKEIKANKEAPVDVEAPKNLAPPNRRESVAPTSIPEDNSPSNAPTRPVSAMSSKLPGVME